MSCPTLHYQNPFRVLTSIGYNFLYGCSGLTSVDLSSLSQVTTIEDYFLYECRGLTSVDLSALSHVTMVGIFFLRGCTGLRTVVVAKASSEVLQNAVASRNE